MKKFLKVLVVLILIVIIIVAVFICKGYNMYKEAVDNVSLEEKVAEIKSKENYTEFSELPPMYVKAVISVEDKRFYKHNGIDIIAIGRALVNDIKAMSYVEGGSTITQQLAKNMYFTQEKIIERKIAEVFMAWQIESNYSKEDIFELYVNTIYFGDGYYTVKDACRGYFNKELDEMTDYECILLAGIPNAPSVYAPTKNPELAKQRQKQVMQKMIENGLLTEEEASEILKMINGIK